MNNGAMDHQMQDDFLRQPSWGKKFGLIKIENPNLNNKN
jgi:hypothetical protein